MFCVYTFSVSGKLVIIIQFNGCVIRTLRIVPYVCVVRKRVPY